VAECALSLQLISKSGIVVTLILLSRIDGDAPRAANISAGRLDGSRAGLFQTLEAALSKSIRTWSFERQPFSPKPIRFAASF